MLKLGVVGIGGYAISVGRNALEAQAGGDGVKFVAACDPRADEQPKQRDHLQSHGVTVLREFDQLLAEDIDAVWLPIPIDLHRPYTVRALAAGKAVIVEKPAAGTIDEIDSMIAARDRSGLPVAVGFQNMSEPKTWAVKQSLIDGKLGEIRQASVIACWPRGETYYSRAAWAGRVSRDGTWVLDSPINNALAHFVNLSLFLLGRELKSPAVPTWVQAKLQRAYPIEMFDTCMVRTGLDSGIPLVIALTHACSRTIEPMITIEGTKGTLRFFHQNQQFQFSDAQGNVTETILGYPHPVRQVLQQFARMMRGEQPTYLATLEQARTHTLLVNAISEAAPITDVPADQIDVMPEQHGSLSQRAIRNIEDTILDCAKADTHAFDDIGGRFDLANYRHFSGLYRNS